MITSTEGVVLTLCGWIAGVAVGYPVGILVSERMHRKLQRLRREQVPAAPAGASLEGSRETEVPHLTYPFVAPRRPPRQMS